eukprot:1023613-Prorocentrum_minimum.AAC.1
MTEAGGSGGSEAPADGRPEWVPPEWAAWVTAHTRIPGQPLGIDATHRRYVSAHQLGPGTAGFAPGTTGFAPGTTGLAPGTAGLAPGTTGVAPGTA